MEDLVLCLHTTEMGQTGRSGVSLDTCCLASWWGSELKRAFLKARGSECKGQAFSPSFPLYLTVHRDIPEGKSALFDLGLGPGF